MILWQVGVFNVNLVINKKGFDILNSLDNSHQRRNRIIPSLDDNHE